MSRIFQANNAVRKEVPLILSIFSPSGGGKTWSALEIATGIQEVYGGEIVGIDTESLRMLHYAYDETTKKGFKFKHIPFVPPFSPADYMAAGEYALSQKPACIIWDSASHEHDGPGGLLEMHETELDRMAGQDYARRDKMNLAAWIKPKGERRKFINWMVQTNVPMIFLFRARELTKLLGGNGEKSRMVDMGFTPIGATEFVFESVASFFLPPRANGVPDWKSQLPNERMMMKQPEQFKELLKDGVRLSRDVGKQMALWAKGAPPPAPPRPMPELVAAGDAIAPTGEDAYKKFWTKTLTEAERQLLGGAEGQQHKDWKSIAAAKGTT